MNGDCAVEFLLEVLSEEIGIEWRQVCIGTQVEYYCSLMKNERRELEERNGQSHAT